jgi:predicted metal-dependent enzyme (double-stranded beta helix superfamily)
MTQLLSSVPPSALALPSSLQTLIQDLRNYQMLTPERARQLVLAAQVRAEDLQPWADFDHPITDSYGRRLVYDGGDFEIMVMSWAPGDVSAIHDHGSAQWGAVQCFGPAEHGVYQLTGTQLSTAHISLVKPGTVMAVDHELIHQMGNPGDDPFLSLHLYGNLNAIGPVTQDARMFDLFDGSIQYTNGGVFFCLPAEQIHHRLEGLQGDPKTTMRHHQQMLARVSRMLTAHESSPSLWHRASLLQAQIAQLEAQIAQHTA